MSTLSLAPPQNTYHKHIWSASPFFYQCVLARIDTQDNQLQGVASSQDYSSYILGIFVLITLSDTIHTIYWRG